METPWIFSIPRKSCLNGEDTVLVLNLPLISIAHEILHVGLRWVHFSPRPNLITEQPSEALFSCKYNHSERIEMIMISDWFSSHIITLAGGMMTHPRATE